MVGLTLDSIVAGGKWGRPRDNTLFYLYRTEKASYRTLVQYVRQLRMCARCFCLSAIGLAVTLLLVFGSSAISEHWLVSTSGQCSVANVTNTSITFQYTPEVYVRFTDYPFHKTKTYTNLFMMAVDLASPGWDHRNIALTVDELIIVFEVLKHDHAHGEVAYTGRILNGDKLPGIPDEGIQIAATNCSLYVDAEKQCSDQPLLAMSVKQLIEQVQSDARDGTLADKYTSCSECNGDSCTYKTWERHDQLGGNLSWLECDNAPLCSDLCAALGISLANDGVCDDGGSARDGGSESSNGYCPFGTDCGDCGTRDPLLQSYDLDE